MQRRYFLGLATALLGGVQHANALATHGTREQAMTLVHKAVALISTEGKDKAFATIDDSSGPFVNGDLYVFVIGPDGTTLAHGANRALIGKTLLHMKDADGTEFVKAMIDTAQSKGQGWVDYHWSDPITKKIEPKSSFVMKSGDLTVGCGVYKG